MGESGGRREGLVEVIGGDREGLLRGMRLGKGLAWVEAGGGGGEDASVWKGSAAVKGSYERAGALNCAFKIGTLEEEWD